ncbi:hypothetical protein HK096_007200, partial [Nowakowskiella sp. JEL0078]
GENVAGSASIVKRVFDEGHQIGGHSFTHPHLPTLNTSDVISEISKTESSIKKIIGLSVAMMRPPFGESSDQTLKAIHSLGQIAVNWNIDSNDWQLKDPYIAFDQFLKPGGSRGYISLQHDRHETPEKVDSIIKLAKSRGFQLVTMADCLGKQPYKEGNGNLIQNSGNQTINGSPLSTNSQLTATQTVNVGSSTGKSKPTKTMIATPLPAQLDGLKSAGIKTNSRILLNFSALVMYITIWSII